MLGTKNETFMAATEERRLTPGPGSRPFPPFEDTHTWGKSLNVPFSSPLRRRAKVSEAMLASSSWIPGRPGRERGT